MPLAIHTGEDLAAAAPSRLVADWLRGGTTLGDATADLIRIAASPPTAAPWFAGGGPRAWVDTMFAELPGRAERRRFTSDAAALARGEARVVVTGQQPGFAGGPLLTVLKVATAVALANRESAAGRPTVPVFWLGDDDDDLREALAPVLGGAAADDLVASDLRSPADAGVLSRRRLSAFALPDGHAALGTWLGRFAHPQDDLGLHALWREAAARGDSWSTFIRRALLRVFAGTGLMIVSGDDDELHGAAAPCYRALLARRDELGELARRRGGELVAGGWHAQIGARSLDRSLFRVRGTGRAAVDADAAAVPAAELRPGVLLRSPVQDWLLAPAAVVVGPAEAAYLRQLESVYAALDLRRSPLVHRLGAWLVPAGFDRGQLIARADDVPARGAVGPAWLDVWLDDTAAGLADLFQERLGVAPERARELVAGRTRRWYKGLRSLVVGEARRLGAARPRPGPAWVFPEGVRQERRLAWYGAFARWGGDLRDALVEAADAHLAGGAEGRWREMEITVTEPEVNDERQP